MATFVLTDLARDLGVESFSIDNQSLGLLAASRCTVRSDGCAAAGARASTWWRSITAACVRHDPRGAWASGRAYDGDRLGWDSPVADGPVNPAFVNLAARRPGLARRLRRAPGTLRPGWNGAP